MNPSGPHHENLEGALSLEQLRVLHACSWPSLQDDIARRRVKEISEADVVPIDETLDDEATYLRTHRTHILDVQDVDEDDLMPRRGRCAPREDVAQHREDRRTDTPSSPADSRRPSHRGRALPLQPTRDGVRIIEPIAPEPMPIAGPYR